MSVEHILAKKGREVVTIGPDQPLSEAVDTLNRHRIGATVIADASGAVLGILSERDIIRALAERGASVLDEPISSRMTREVVSCTLASSIDEIMATMTRGKFRHVPVVEAGRLGGIVSIGDVVKHRLADIEAEHQALRDYIATA